MNEQQKINLDLPAQELLARKSIEAIKSIAYNYIDSLDWDAALDLARKLELKFKQFVPENDNEKYWYSVVRYWIMRLKLFAFANLKSGEKQDLIQNYTLEILKNGVDLESYMFRYIDFFNTPSIIEQETKNLILALTNNQEVLGKDNTNFKQQNFFPSVKNWIAQYQIVQNRGRSAQLKPGAFEIHDFFNSNQHVRYLSGAEKIYLKSILNFYNWLQNPIVFRETPLPQHGRSVGELKEILNKQEPSTPRTLQPVPVNLPTAQEIKREVDTPELISHSSPLLKGEDVPKGQERLYAHVAPGQVKTEAKMEDKFKHPLMGVMAPPRPSAPRPITPQVETKPKGLSSIENVEGLKKIDVAMLRQGPLFEQIKIIKAKISQLAQVNHLMPFQTVIAFEQSPLFRLYLEVGSLIITGKDQNPAGQFEQISKKLSSEGKETLTLQEFEALADLRKQIEML